MSKFISLILVPSYLNGIGCNSVPAEFVKWNCPDSQFGTFHFHFKGHQDEIVFKVNS